MTSSEHAQLSVLATAVDELIERVAALAEQFDGTGDRAEAASALFEAERSMRMSGRHVNRAVRALT